MINDVEKLLERYRQFPDRSDFVPEIKEDKITFLFNGEKGLYKAKFLAFEFGMNCEYSESDRPKIFEILENIEDGIKDDYGADQSTDDLDDVENLLSKSYEEAPTIRTLNKILISAAKTGASDLHFEGNGNSFKVRYRIDGILKTMHHFPKDQQDTIIARIKVMAGLNLSEMRKTQDGRINLSIGNRKVDVRVSVIPTVNGEKAVLRLLENNQGLIQLSATGMLDDMLSDFLDVLKKPSGIILVTGPTGSGKTTTLYAAIKELISDEKNIVTIEDPVEYRIDSITQMQVNPHAGIDFASSVRSFLRQDPDIILVGEIRDEETAKAAIQASLTGHLVLSTLHTNDAPTAVARLLDMDIEPFLISSTVSATLAQRLVRRVCPKCRVKKTIPEAVKILFKGLLDNVEHYYEGEGCPHCFNTGYKGRVAVFEYLKFVSDIRNTISADSSAEAIKNAALKTGYKPIIYQGAKLIESGITTPSEVITVAQVE